MRSKKDICWLAFSDTNIHRQVIKWLIQIYIFARSRPILKVYYILWPLYISCSLFLNAQWETRAIASLICFDIRIQEMVFLCYAIWFLLPECITFFSVFFFFLHCFDCYCWLVCILHTENTDQFLMWNLSTIILLHFFSFCQKSKRKEEITKE